MRLIICVFSVLFLMCSTLVNAHENWERLPDTPTLPKTGHSGYAQINGARIWYATFGKGKPIILLHGGLANANYWGNLVSQLSSDNLVIVMDTRGHGKSSNEHDSYSYELMANDVIGLMNFLKIKKAAVIGWSDGGIIGLHLAINQPQRLTKLFCFGANSNPNGVASDYSKSAVFNAYFKRVENEYKTLSPVPQRYQAFKQHLINLVEKEPNFTKLQLNSISVPTWIVDGDHDEGIKLENTLYMWKEIPKSKLLILPNTNHFAFLQDPPLFFASVKSFLNDYPVRDKK